MVTSCQDCFFAEYLNHVQIGCGLNILRKYIVNKIAVEAYNREIRGKQQFYILPDTACIGKVPIKFVEDQKLDESTLKDYVKDRLKIRWQCIIFLNNENIEPCLDSILAQSIKPDNVSVVLNYNSKIISPKVARWLQNRNFKTWRVVETENPELSRGNLVDMVLDRYDNPFYLVFNADKVLPDDFIEKLNQTINEELISFGILKIDDVEVVATGIHKFYNGNSLGQTLEEKLIEAKCQDKIISLKF